MKILAQRLGLVNRKLNHELRMNGAEMCVWDVFEILDTAWVFSHSNRVM